ncbi:MAG: phage head-tail joining protein [Alphaproteobacteria bacterium]
MATVYTADDLAKLKRLLIAGAGRVTVGGKTIEYRSSAEIEKAITTVAGELARDAGTGPVRQILMTSRRGTS